MIGQHLYVMDLVEPRGVRQLVGILRRDDLIELGRVQPRSVGIHAMCDSSWRFAGERVVAGTR